MAEKTKRDPFGPWMNGFSYDQAFDGSTWTLSKGEDFDQAASTVAAKIRDEYERRYGSLEIKIDGDSIYVRRVGPS